MVLISNVKADSAQTTAQVFRQILLIKNVHEGNN
jgi:hypothetical protein